MSIKFDKIVTGMVLLDIHRQKMGNTTMSEWGLWKVKIISIDRTKRMAMVSWNGNPPQMWMERELKRLYTKETKAYRDQYERRMRGDWL